MGGSGSFCLAELDPLPLPLKKPFFEDFTFMFATANSTAVLMACCTPSPKRELHSAYVTPREEARDWPSDFATIHLPSDALL